MLGICLNALLDQHLVCTGSSHAKEKNKTLCFLSIRIQFLFIVIVQAGPLLSLLLFYTELPGRNHGSLLSKTVLLRAGTGPVFACLH